MKPKLGDNTIRSNHTPIPIRKKNNIKLVDPLYNKSSRPLTPTPGLHSRTNNKPRVLVISKDKKIRKYPLINNSGNKPSNLSEVSFDNNLASKSTASKRNGRNNKNKLKKNFSGLIGQVSQDNDELLIKINTDLFVRNSLLPMSVLFSFHQLFDSKFTLLKFLSKKELLNFALINKSYGRLFLNEFIVQIETEMSQIETDLTKAKMKHKEANDKTALNEQQQHKIAFSNKAIKASELLDEELYLEMFKQKKPPNDNVLYIYYLLLNMFNSSLTIDSIKEAYHNGHDSFSGYGMSLGFWNKLTVYLQSKTNNRFGAFIIKKLHKFNFIRTHLDSIYEIASKNYQLINPSHYTKVCPTTALVTFIIKDFLDYFNISNNLLILQDKQSKYKGLFERIIKIKQNIYSCN